MKTLTDRGTEAERVLTLGPTTDVEYCDRVLRALWEENWFDGCKGPERTSYRGAVGQPGHLFLKVEITDHKLQITEGGLFRLQENAPGLWEVHSQLLPNCRGELALQAYRAGARYMFETAGAQRLSGSAPSWHRHAVLLAVRFGFQIVGRDCSRLSRGGHAAGITHYELTRSRWLDLTEKE